VCVPLPLGQNRVKTAAFRECLGWGRRRSAVDPDGTHRIWFDYEISL
jgi:hypothetical protein